VPRPNFFIVGAPKCGTTAMHEYLRQHPDIFLPDFKEPHFFGADLRPEGYRRDLRAYEALFEDWSGQTRVGESSTWYLFSKLAAGEIKAYSPDAEILIMLRHPVDMLYSLYHQMVFNGQRLPPFAEAIETEDDRLAAWRETVDKREAAGLKLRNCFHSSVACYADQVRRYLDVFGPDHVHVILFDDLRASAPRVYRETLEVLGVDSDVEVDFRVYNANKQVRSATARALMRATPLWVRRLADRALGQRLRRRLTTAVKGLNTRFEPREPMDPAVRERLQERFEPEIERLAALLGRDLSCWRR